MDARQVPDEIRTEAETWIKAVVRPQWLPNDLGKSLKARRNTYKGEPTIDILYANYAISGGELRIVEGGGSVNLLWHDKDLRVGLDVAKSAKDPAMRLLNLPEARIKDYKLLVAEFKITDAKSLYKVVMRLPKEAGWKSELGFYYTDDGKLVIESEWYDVIDLWITPGFIGLGVPKHKPGTYHPQVGGPSPPRFLDQVPAQNSPAETVPQSNFSRETPRALRRRKCSTSEIPFVRCGYCRGCSCGQHHFRVYAHKKTATTRIRRDSAVRRAPINRGGKRRNKG